MSQRRFRTDPSPFLLILLALALTLSAFAAAPATASSPAPSYPAVLKSVASGHSECLTFKGNGHDLHPERYNWGTGNYCGLDGGRDELLDNRQAVWTVVPLGGDLHLLMNSSAGQDECLIFSDNGQATYPSRYNWGPGPYCGFPGGLQGLLDNRQAVWRFTDLGANRYMITNASRGPEECLVFADGSARFPSRRSWGDGPFCGFSGGESAFLEDGQGVFTVEPLQLDNFTPPQSWFDGYLMLSGGRWPNQRLHVGHDGNGQVYVSWGDDRAYRFQAEPTGDGRFFFLRNALHPSQRLHVGHNGNGLLYASDGSDDAYRWTAEPGGPRDFRFRNKKYPHQFLYLARDGSGRVSASPGGTHWELQVLPTMDAQADNNINMERAFGGRNFNLQNARFTDQRLHVGHDGNGLLYAGSGSDPAYRWYIGGAVGGYLTLTNDFHRDQRLRVRADNSGVVSAGPGTQDETSWRLEPYGVNEFYLTSKLHPQRRLTVSSDGHGFVSATEGQHAESRWTLHPAERRPYFWTSQAATCRNPTSEQEQVFKFCAYPAAHQSGNPYCVVGAVNESGGHDKAFSADLPADIAALAYSFSAEECGGGPAPTTFLYGAPSQESDTLVFPKQWTGGMGSLQGRAHSFTVIDNGHGGSSGAYVCLYTKKDWTGRQHCSPITGTGHKNLSSGFNDQISSIQAFPSWWFIKLTLYQHYGAQGEGLHTRFYFDANPQAWENLRFHFMLAEFDTWDKHVSSYFVSFGL